MTVTISPADELVQLARAAIAHDYRGAKAEHRLRALQWIDAHGFPTHKDEDWCYLPLDSIFDWSFRPSDIPSQRVLADTVDGVAPDLGCPRLVFVNGYFATRASKLAGLPDGLTVQTTSAASAQDPLAEDPSRPLVGYRHAFEALNDALGVGATIRLDAEVVLDDPIHLVYLFDPTGSPPLSSPRAAITAGPRSRLHLVETFVGLTGGPGLTNAVTAVRCGEGADVSMDLVQDEAPDSIHLSLVDVHQDRHSRFSCRSFALGAKIARHEIRARLAGEGADVQLDGLFLPRGAQRHDHPVLVEHAAPSTRSRQHYQGIADDDSHGVFNGRIVVRPDAPGTDAEQTNRNLLLSEHAEIDTRPRLEIFTDDVRCAHGATVGRLDETALSYLRSRGVPEPQARSMLIHAVVDQIVGHVTLDALRTDVASRVARIIDGNEEAR